MLKAQKSILQQRRLYKLFIKQYYSIPNPLEHTGNDVKAQCSHMRVVISARFQPERANIRRCTAPILKVECHSILASLLSDRFPMCPFFHFFFIFSHFFHTRASDQFLGAIIFAQFSWHVHEFFQIPNNLEEL